MGRPWSNAATFKYRRGMLVTLNGMPGVWKIYSPHPDEGFYWAEPYDEHARALLTLTGNNSHILEFSPTSIPGKGCTVAIEHGMVVAPTGDITRLPLPKENELK